jgi:hypothetical protein
MAVNFESEHTRNTEYRFLPENIVIRPELNGRHEKPDIEWLIADILRNGQIQPVSIWSDGGECVLAAGFSRWRAISEINKRKLTPKPLELRCTVIKCNEQGAFVRNISENRMRNPVSAIDDAHNMQRLIEAYQMDETEIAKIYFPTAATEDELKEALKWVRNRIELIKLTPEAERAVRDGRLNETAASAIAKLNSAQQREALKKHPEGKITKKDVKQASPAKPKKAAAPFKRDPELMRRVTALLEDIEGVLEGSKDQYIEVDRVLLLNLSNYVKELR